MSIPEKIIQTQDDMTQLHKTKTYKDYFEFIKQLQDSVRSISISETKRIERFKIFDQYFLQVKKILEETPPKEGKMRFGNIAFRDFHFKLTIYHKQFVDELSEFLNFDKKYSLELQTFLNESYGDESRIDYGTGHELNFMVFLFCLNRLKPFKEEEREALVHEVFYDYIFIMRKVQLQYKLEPAGSHGVWGLDDYHFLPFIFGGAELIDHEQVKTPADGMKQKFLELYSDDYMYLNCLSFIKNVKKGVPLSHSSPYLYDISAAESWVKVANGMIKMYSVEVFSKIVVMKHLRFGEIFNFEQIIIMKYPRYFFRVIFSFFISSVILKTQVDYYDFLSRKSQDQFVLTFFQKKSCSLEQLEHEVKDQQIFQKEQIIVERINLEEVEGFPSFYQDNEDCQAVFYVNQQPIEMLDFNQWLQHDNLLFEISNFVTNIIGSISKQITSFQQLQELSNSQGIIGLFIGQPGEDFKKFQNLAKHNLEFSFYHIFNEKLINDINEQFQQDFDRRNYFGILRSKNLINEYDYKRLVSTHLFDNLENFFSLEQYPKMRSVKNIDETIQQFLWNDKILWLYQKSKKNVKEFKTLVQSLPKKYIFLMIEDQDEFSLISSIVEEEQFEEGTLLILSNDIDQIKKKKFQNFSSPDQILEFLKELRKENRHEYSAQELQLKIIRLFFFCLKF